MTTENPGEKSGKKSSKLRDTHTHTQIITTNKFGQEKFIFTKKYAMRVPSTLHVATLFILEKTCVQKKLAKFACLIMLNFVI